MSEASGRGRFGLILFAVGCALFMFLGSPDLVHGRSFSRLWNLGHIAAFTVWSLLLLRHWAGLAARPFRAQAVTVLLFCLLAGGTVELIQSLSGRYSSLADMGRNVLGGLTALLFLFPGRLSIKTSLLRRWQIVTLALLLIALAPLVRSFIDEWTARRQFPVLASFETPFELDRWSGNARLTIDRTISQSGRSSLRLDLTTATYSGAELQYFPGNWQNYRTVKLSVYNPDRTPITIVCKIRDHQHDIAGYRYKDRFNRSYSANSGWNHIHIPLIDVETAPEHRNMDLTRITGFQLFTVRLPATRTIYLDHLLLTR